MGIGINHTYMLGEFKVAQVKMKQNHAKNICFFVSLQVTTK